MLIAGVDAGNYEVKVVSNHGATKILSAIGEFRERKLSQVFSDDDIVYEYNDKKGFAGTLAQYESEFYTSTMGDTKAHEEMVLRVLLGLARHSAEDTFSIVCGQPICNHGKTATSKIKSLLEKKHRIVINQVERTLTIKRVEVAAEGGAAFWSSPRDGVVHIIDFGSGTVNAATLNDGRYIDKASFTLALGLNTTKSSDLNELARLVCVEALKSWSKDDEVLLVGGGATRLHAPVKSYFTRATVLSPSLCIGNGATQLTANYANALGFYEIAKEVNA